MVDTVIAVATLVITMLTWCDEVQWGYDHIPAYITWLASKRGESTGIRYKHNPCRNYRVSAPERLI